MKQIIIAKDDLFRLLKYGGLSYDSMRIKLFGITQNDIKEIFENYVEECESVEEYEEIVEVEDDEISYEEILILLLNANMKNLDKARIYRKLKKILDEKYE